MNAVGEWRATYAPGEWLVLCGPASVVVVEPPGEGWTSLVAELWQQVLASSSLVDLADRLARYGLDSMPSFGALFWSADGMRSLVRGSVSVVDPATGRIVADGVGIQTWSEVGLGELTTVRIETRSTAAPDALELPLVVGAVRASSVLLDAREQARVHSPQLEQDRRAAGSEDSGQPTEPTQPFDGELTPEPAEVAPAEVGTAVEPTQPLPDDVAAASQDAQRIALENADTALVQDSPVAAEAGPVPAAAPPSGPTVEATVCPHGHPNPPGAARCRDCGVRVTDRGARWVVQPVLAVLRVSDGAEAPVDRPVLVGRAPVDRPGAPARLLTVPSPGHDISRTHLEVVPDGWQLLVTDLHSTNGTLLVSPGSSERRLLPPGEPVEVRLGSLLELADGVSVLIDEPQ